MARNLREVIAAVQTERHAKIAAALAEQFGRRAPASWGRFSGPEQNPIVTELAGPKTLFSFVVPNQSSLPTFQMM
jgi:hypothetical protein